MHTLKQLQNGELKGATRILLSEGLDHFPEELFELADTLEMIDLSYNNISALPADFGRLKKLRILFCNGNLFTVLPEVLGDCPHLYLAGFKSNQVTTIPPKALNPNLRWLILTGNKVTALPPEIGRCSRLEKLMLAGNWLTELPVELSHCQNLALLRIAANRLTNFPQWLLTMPKLSWLAFSGNPFCGKPIFEPLDPINWDDLSIQHLLGEGASGMIYKASKIVNDEEHHLAIKIFKGEVTSDGYPEDEMAICITAGPHPGLVQITGHVVAHPEDKKGFVMELIPGHYTNLGQPPSLDSCTRDVFPNNPKLTIQQVLTIAATIASVALQLHSRGIMHSDLYAHNILTDEDGNTLFSDFGAACFYGDMDEHTAAALQRIEVSAFGYLLDDLISLCDAKDSPVLTAIGNLRDACHNPVVLARPDFLSLLNELQLLHVSL